MQIAGEFGLERIIASRLGERYIAASQHIRARDAGPLVVAMDIGETSTTLTCAVALTTIQTAFLWSKCIGPRWRGNWTDAVEYKKVRRPTDLERYWRYLNACEMLHATVLVVSCRRGELTFTDEGDHELEDVSDALGFTLSKKMFERLRCVTAVITAAIQPYDPGQHFIHLWSDQDALFQPAERATAAQHWISAHLQATYGRQVLAHLTTEDQVRDRLFAADFIGIPDSAAGGIGDYSDCYDTAYGSADRLLMLPPAGAKAKAVMVAKWFSLPTRGLTKVAMKLSAQRDRQGRRVGYELTEWEFGMVPL